MATYVNDLRLKEISTGDESGTWGTSTNTNLELIGEALGYATEQSFGSDADATTTVADGVSDPARAMYFKVTSAVSLTATRTLTIAPNTVSRVMFIENATSGSQSIAISQGSGANVTIATGKTAIVYLDGAGAGAAVVDAMAGVDPGVTDTLAEVLTAGNATGGTDIAVGTGDDVTFADSSKAIFGAGSDLSIYSDGTQSFIQEDGPGALYIQGTHLNLNNAAGNASYITAVDGGAVTLFSGGSAKLATTSTGIDVTGVITTDGMTTSADINFGNNVKAIFGTGNNLQIRHDGSNNFVSSELGDLVIQVTEDDSDVAILSDNGSGGTADYFRADGSTGASILYNYGNQKLATTSTGIDVTGSVVSDGLTVEGVSKLKAGSTSTPADTAAFISNASAKIVVNHGNEYGAYVGYANSSNDAIGIQSTTSGGTTAPLSLNTYGGNVGIGTTSPSVALDVQAASGASRINVGTGSVAGDHGVNIVSGGANNDYGVFFNGSMALGSNTTTGTQLKIGSNGSETTFQTLTFHTNASERVRIDSSGHIGINVTSSLDQKINMSDTADVGIKMTKTGSITTTVRAVGGALAFGVDGSAGTTERFSIDSSGNATVKAAGELRIRDDGTFIKEDQGLQIGNTSGTGTTRPIRFFTESTERMRVDASGNLLVGRTSTPPTAGAKIAIAGSGDTAIQITKDGVIASRVSAVSSGLAFGVDGSDGATERMRIDSSGNLLVGKTSTGSSVVGQELRANGYNVFTRDGDTPLELYRKTSDGSMLNFTKDGTIVGSIGTSSGDLTIGTGDTGIRFDDGTDQIYPVNGTSTRDGAIDLGWSSGRFKDLYLSSAVKFGSQDALATDGTSNYIKSGSAIYFQPANTTKMLLDSSGNLLVGKTSTGDYVTGFEVQPAGAVLAYRSGGVASIFGRTNDGEITRFTRGGAIVGYAGAAVGNAYFSGTARGWTFGGSNIYPADQTGAKQDNNTDLGHGSYRFQDIYATNATIQTSDRNEKQDIEALSDAEQRVAVAAKGLLRKFRWKSSVAENGDDARIHFGIIAQDLQDAFTAEGLDAGRYAMFINSTWTDEETGEERSRMGVRYSELLAFIIAAI